MSFEERIRSNISYAAFWYSCYGSASILMFLTSVFNWRIIGCFDYWLPFDVLFRCFVRLYIPLGSFSRFLFIFHPDVSITVNLFPVQLQDVPIFPWFRSCCYNTFLLLAVGWILLFSLSGYRSLTFAFSVLISFSWMSCISSNSSLYFRIVLSHLWCSSSNVLQHFFQQIIVSFNIC